MMMVPDDLRSKSDEELRLLAEESRKLLEEREKEKKRKAIEAIRKIAAEHDLSVDIKDKPRRRRGRPPKKETASPVAQTAPE